MIRLSFRHIVLILILFALTACGLFKKKEEVVEYSDIQIKYAEILEVSPDSILNEELYKHIDQWIGTPYLWGGETDEGIDCSAFVQNTYLTVYQKTIPRTTNAQINSDIISLYRDKSHLEEGDLIYFRLDKNVDKLVSHVGLYLQNNKFVHSSVSTRGVAISDITDPKWKKIYFACGRVN